MKSINKKVANLIWMDALSTTAIEAVPMKNNQFIESFTSYCAREGYDPVSATNALQQLSVLDSKGKPDMELVDGHFLYDLAMYRDESPEGGIQAGLFVTKGELIFWICS